MKQLSTSILLTMLMSMVGIKALAWEDIAVENADGVTIYYNYINDGTELEVTHYNHGYYPNPERYKGNVVIPEEVVFMNRTRKVTRIGEGAFSSCDELTSVTMPQSITTIGGSAFYNCSLTSLIIPNSVTNIGSGAFSGSNLTSINIPNNVTAIGDKTFKGCRGLISVTIGNSVTSIGNSAFESCEALSSVIIPNSVTSIGASAFRWCYGLTSLIIGNSVTDIGSNAFYACKKITSVNIPNSVKTIGSEAFAFCEGMTSLTIGDGVTGISNFAFQSCKSLSSVTLPNSLTSLGQGVFSGIDFPIVISKIEEPFHITVLGVFSNNTYKNATLYVPVGTTQKYRNIMEWNQFLYIEEGTGGATTQEKCAKPTISYQNGKLSFNCETEGVNYQYDITNLDIKAGIAQEIELGVTYSINVYATKPGYENSNISTATLCWIDVEPKTEGIENSIAQVRANAVLIQTENGQISIVGTDDGTIIHAYEIDGQLVGSAISHNGYANLNTNIKPGSIAIIKIGDRSVKVVVK